VARLDVGARSVCCLVGLLSVQLAVSCQLVNEVGVCVIQPGADQFALSPCRPRPFYSFLMEP